jgi:hypothetical protein
MVAQSLHKRVHNSAEFNIALSYINLLDIITRKFLDISRGPT